MKKKQFNEVIARKISVQQRRLSRKAIQARRRDGFSSLSNVGHMYTGLERHTLLMASGVAIFESEALPGMDTSFGETELHLAQRRAAASKRTIEFVRDPYKFNGCTRGDKLTRAERKLLLDKVKHYASVEGITVTRRQIIQIVNCYCPYKTVTYVPADPFEARLRTKRHHMRWVVRLARICLTYVQLGSEFPKLGSGFPMWTYYKSDRSFTYRGIDYLAQTVRYNRGVGALADNVKEMGTLHETKDVPALRAAILKIANEKTPEILQRLNGGGTEKLDALRAPPGALDADSAGRFSAPVKEGFLPGTRLEGIPNYSQT